MPLPGYLQGNTIKSLQDYQNTIPKMFDTSGLDQSYNALNQSNFSQGRALAAAAGASYSNRAAQSGGSRLGAGFAEAQSMLPIYNQGHQLLADLATKKLQAATGQAAAGGDTARAIGQLQQSRQAMLADYFGNQQRIGLQKQQLAQNQTQFNSDLGFRNQQLAQQQSQFGDTLGLQKQQLASQTQNQANDTRLRSLQLALGQPQKSYSFSTDMFGNPVSVGDAQAQQGFQQQNSYYNNLRTQLNNLI